ncbi:MAG: hypothetical protein ACR2F6_00905 [Mycobacteriales bacterium]
MTEPRDQRTKHDLDAISDRLTVEFAERHHRAAIEDCVRRCDAELDTATSPARPELVERLARQRLIDLEPS